MIGELGDRIATLVQDNLVEIPDFPEDFRAGFVSIVAAPTSANRP